MNQENSHPVSRRSFLKGTSTAAAGVTAFTILKPHQVFAAEANSMIQMGIIGTGGRGGFDGRNLVLTNKVKVVALSDYFDFQMKEPAMQFDVKPERCFPGIDGYK
nr:twin-arginine translocation signal domain-containing protein [bacterium]